MATILLLCAPLASSFGLGVRTTYSGAAPAFAPLVSPLRLSATNEASTDPPPLVDCYVPPDLSGRVAVVTGATRGIGKGIALELGAAGCTVYVTGRSTRGAGGMTTERDMAGEECTVERTSEEIDALPGPGQGIPVKCDASDDAQVAALLARVAEEQGGRLDVLVCSAFTTPPQLNDASFRDDFWKQGADMWDACHGVGLRGAYMACCEAAPVMIDTASKGGTGGGRPLMVLISSFGGVSYTFNVAYGVGKAGADRLASDMSYQLSKHGVDTVSLYPGVVRTEGNVAMDERGEWEAASGGLDIKPGGMNESPRFSGRAVAKLLADPDLTKDRSGDVVVVTEFAKELGFTDIDGSTPPSIRSLKFILPSFVFPQIEKESGAALPAWITDNVPDFLLPWSVFSGGPPPTSD